MTGSCSSNESTTARSRSGFAVKGAVLARPAIASRCGPSAACLAGTDRAVINAERWGSVRIPTGHPQLPWYVVNHEVGLG
jgi:hypothetical protein